MSTMGFSNRFVVVVFTAWTLIMVLPSSVANQFTTDSVLSITKLGDSAHDLLPQYGLPKGLLPDAVESYTLFPNGEFEITLDRTCYVHFSNLVYYEKKITGKISYCSITNITGIQAKKLFVWVSVTGIDVDADSDLIEFHVGFLSEKLPAKEFEEVPSCKARVSEEFLLKSVFAF